MYLYVSKTSSLQNPHSLYILFFHCLKYVLKLSSEIMNNFLITFCFISSMLWCFIFHVIFLIFGKRNISQEAMPVHYEHCQTSNIWCLVTKNCWASYITWHTAMVEPPYTTKISLLQWSACFKYYNINTVLIYSLTWYSSPLCVCFMRNNHCLKLTTILFCFFF